MDLGRIRKQQLTRRRSLLRAAPKDNVSASVVASNTLLQHKPATSTSSSTSSPSSAAGTASHWTARAAVAQETRLPILAHNIGRRSRPATITTTIASHDKIYDENTAPSSSNESNQHLKLQKDSNDPSPLSSSHKPPTTPASNKHFSRNNPFASFADLTPIAPHRVGHEDNNDVNGNDNDEEVQLGSTTAKLAMISSFVGIDRSSASLAPVACSTPVPVTAHIVTSTANTTTTPLGGHVLKALSEMRSSRVQSLPPMLLSGVKRPRESSIDHDENHNGDKDQDDNTTPIREGYTSAQLSDNSIQTPTVAQVNTPTTITNRSFSINQSKLLRIVESGRAGVKSIREDTMDWLHELNITPLRKDRRISIMDNKQQLTSTEPLSANNRKRMRRNKPTIHTSIPVEWTLKTGVTLLSAASFDFFAESNPCDSINGFVEMALNKGVPSLNMPQSLYQYLQSWIYPADDRPPSSISLTATILTKVTSQRDGSILKDEVDKLKSYEKLELEHLQAMEKKWRESLDSLTILLQGNKVDYFYYVNANFSVVFFSKSRAKTRFVASMSGSTAGLRKELLENKIKFRVVPHISNTIELTTTPMKTDGNGMIVSHATRAESTDCLQFFDQEVFKLLGYLRSWHDPDIKQRSHRCPRLLSPCPFFNATLHQAQISRFERVRYNVVDPVSKQRIEHMHKLELKGIFLPTLLNAFLNLVREKVMREQPVSASNLMHKMETVHSPPTTTTTTSANRDLHGSDMETKESEMENDGMMTTGDNETHRDGNGGVDMVDGGKQQPQLLTITFDTMDRTRYLLPFDELQWRNSKMSGSRKTCASQVVCRHRVVLLK